jgi:hypothetical protein
MKVKNYTPTKEGYDTLLEDNLYLLEISRTIAMNYMILSPESRNGVDRSKELSDLLNYCGIKLKSKKIKDKDFYNKLFGEFVKEIDSIECDSDHIISGVVKIANICEKTRMKVIEYRASKKSIFKLVLG